MAWNELPDFSANTYRAGKCSICKTHARQHSDGSRDRVFTTGEMIDFEGWFEICETCLTEAARNFLGFVPKSQYEEQLDLNVQATLMIEDLQQACEDKDDAVSLLVSELARKVEVRA